MSSFNNKQPTFPFYGYQIVPFVFPSPVIAAQGNIYCQQAFSPSISEPNVVKDQKVPDVVLPLKEKTNCTSKLEAECSHAKKNGTWSAHEHNLFLEAMEKFGNDWAAVVKYIGTRSASQVRSHAQKHYGRLRKSAIAKIKCDPENTKAIFVVTKEYRNRSRLYKPFQKKIAKNEDNNMEYDPLFLQGGLGSTLAIPIPVSQIKNNEICSQ